MCPPGFVGPRCEGDVNECLSNPCSATGTQDCVQLVNDYRCDCKPGFAGRKCDLRVDFCSSSPCLNGGVCSSVPQGHICICSEEFYGNICEHSNNNSCAGNPCKNGGQCRQRKHGYVCVCPTGATGHNCGIDTYNECSSSPCLNGGTCHNRVGIYECECPENWNGAQCGVYDSSFTGGIGIYLKPGTILKTNNENENYDRCEINECYKKSGNRKCNEECNTRECNYDGGDCSLGMNPWMNCTAPINCWDVFRNDECNIECNNIDCLFDGFDCEQKLLPCNEHYDTYCLKNYGNGYCDYGCNNEECNWDGLDCESEPPMLADGSLMAVVLMEPDVFKNNSVPFLREIGHALRTIKGTKVIMEIDNRRCVKSAATECFQTSSKAAQFLTAAQTRQAFAFELEEIHGEDQDKTTRVETTSSNLLYIVVTIVAVAFSGIIFGVLITSRKKARGVTWFPEGFFRTSSSQRRSSHRRGPDGQEMRNLNKLSSTITVDMNSNDNAVPMPPPPVPSSAVSEWSDDDGLDHSPVKRLKSERSQDGSFGDSQSSLSPPEYDENDPRPWTQQHLDAADVRNPDILALTPPQGERDMEPGTVDVNVQGPGGLTPLMCASCRGGGIDMLEDGEDEDGVCGNMVQELLMQGADFNMTLDKTGESPLHLAARYSRADAAKRLLDAGCDANVKDITGRSPLHAAVSADAMGVFQILLRNRATNLNARMNDGTTPLILATRLAIEGMVEELVNADADINAADDHGKSALHWAAAVNNYDAIRVLIAHGANKDAQDNKDETPLFLAAREGSLEATQLLLENLANKEITDHMDRLPHDVARERQHLDIVKLLDEYVPPSPQISNGHLNAGSPMFLMSIHGSTKSKAKRRKLPAGSSSGKDLDSLGLTNDTGLRRKSSVKKRKEPSHILMQGMDGSVSLSPDSLTSPNAVMQNGMDTSEPIYTQLTNVVHLQPGTMKLLPPPYDERLKVNYCGNSGMDSQGLGQTYLDPNSLQNVPTHHARQNSIPNPNNSGVPPSRPYNSSSPIKQRPSLPTSPTHMAAMRAAHHQRTTKLHPQPTGNLIYDYPQAMPELQTGMGSNPKGSMQNNGQQSLYPQIYHYPTPPSQHSHNDGETTPHYLHPPENNYLTPSPDSPGQWSSSSPHSASDWSESMASPMGHNHHSIHSVDHSQHPKTQNVNVKQNKSSITKSPQAVFI
ncbi:neurogenic locus Notch protein [Caerostris extrusa]|uniref:Neurogenic locus Notch protein n=1 Tax=Caerostris extrusa TaxID=172846 RepID=A0AAV4VRD4_CAEEX|nr:neurogenic locus Notch protein [Caerostris extrusa]